MYERKIAEDLNCGITLAVKVFGAKWKPCIIDALDQGITRPKDLHRSLGGTPRVIDMQLSELERFGVVAKKAQTGFPLRTDYELTALGRSIVPIVRQLDKWGTTHMTVIQESLQRMQEEAKSKKTFLKKAS